MRPREKKQPFLLPYKVRDADEGTGQKQSHEHKTLVKICSSHTALIIVSFIKYFSSSNGRNLQTLSCPITWLILILWNSRYVIFFPSSFFSPSRSDALLPLISLILCRSLFLTALPSSKLVVGRFSVTGSSTAGIESWGCGIEVAEGFPKTSSLSSDWLIRDFHRGSGMRVLSHRYCCILDACIASKWYESHFKAKSIDLETASKRTTLEVVQWLSITSVEKTRPCFFWKESDDVMCFTSRAWAGISKSIRGCSEESPKRSGDRMDPEVDELDLPLEPLPLIKSRPARLPSHLLCFIATMVDTLQSS